MSSPALLDRMAANFAEHSCHLHRKTAGMTVVETDDLVIADGDMDDDTFNIITGTRFTSSTVDSRIAETVAAVSDRFTWWVDSTSTPDNLSDRIAEAGFPAMDPEPGMVADLACLPALEIPSGLRIEQVRDAGQFAQYAAILAANWDPPAPGVIGFYARAAAVALDPACQARYFVGYLDDVVVCTTEAFLSHGVAGIYNISTLAGFRRRGFGRAITLSALLAARSEGFETAVLQTSPDGQELYRGLGFTVAGGFTEHSITGSRRSAP
ncbi:GNAT family N-acetyltransferase [Kibdelosporangium philippinense]|uniref:GNAT family N-acetyltransferase n=1 Tax=Kibdelosporangium philippinense TaxID=211113 RepID=A0ABS8ZWN2_9PSEU|nr:GNAT family N-acetyltransferase [Kibdelosporangium philippinense]MCE7012052.1 GNAT family N-acetyltransferase [Kibdelosporangium philippinense]